MTAGMGTGTGRTRAPAAGTTTIVTTGTGTGRGRGWLRGTALGDSVENGTDPPPVPEDGPALDVDDGPAEGDFGEFGREDDDDAAGPEETASDAPPRRSRPRPEIVLFVGGGGQLQYVVPEPDDERLRDKVTASLVVKRHQRLVSHAAFLTQYAASAVRGRSLLEVYEALPVRTKAAESVALNLDAAQYSRDRSILVAIPAGVVPLDFFTWKDPSDEIVVFLAEQSDLFTVRIEGVGGLAARTVAAVNPRRPAGMKPITAGGVRPYVNWVRAARDYPHITTTFVARFRSDPRDAEGLLLEFARSLDRATRSPAAAANAGKWVLRCRRGSDGQITTHWGTDVLHRAILGGFT